MSENASHYSLCRGTEHVRTLPRIKYLKDRGRDCVPASVHLASILLSQFHREIALTHGLEFSIEATSSARRHFLRAVPKSPPTLHFFITVDYLFPPFYLSSTFFLRSVLTILLKCAKNDPIMVVYNEMFTKFVELASHHHKPVLKHFNHLSKVH